MAPEEMASVLDLSRIPWQEQTIATDANNIIILFMSIIHLESHLGAQAYTLGQRIGDSRAYFRIQSRI